MSRQTDVLLDWVSACSPDHQRRRSLGHSIPLITAVLVVAGVIFFCARLAIVGAQADATPTGPSGAPASASMFRGNPARTGEQTGPGPLRQAQLQWAFTTSDRVSSSPVVTGGVVYVGSDDGALYVLDAATGIERWRFQTDSEVASSPAVTNELVYVGSFDGALYALDAATGEERWRFESDEPIFSSPAVVGGVVYVGSDDGALHALDAVTGEERWRFQTSRRIASSPAVVDGAVYVGSLDGALYALDVATGVERWHFQTGDGVHSTPAVSGGLVYIGSFDGEFYALDVATGTERWRFETGGPVFASPSVAEGFVYVGSFDGTLYALDAASGKERWRFETGEAFTSSPAVSQGTAYAGSGRNLYALDTATGTERWRFETGDVLASSPAIAGGLVYVGSWDGAVYAIGSSDGDDSSDSHSQNNTPATDLNGSRGLGSIGSVIDPASRSDTVGETSGLRPLVPSRLQSATPLATPYPSRCPDGENLIPNAGFEAGEVGWYVEGPVEATTSDTHSGSTAIRLGSREAGGYISQRISSVAPDTTYELSAWGKLGADGEMAEIGLLFRGSNEDRLRAEEPPPLRFSSTAFVQQRLMFTVPSQVTNVSVYVYKDPGSAQFYADTLSLTACQVPEELAATPAAIQAVATPAIPAPATFPATPIVAGPPTEVRTSTPLPPTNTPAPTITPRPTAAPVLPTPIPVPPTSTPVPTNTPVPPTSTPVPTNTPVPPTSTPVPATTASEEQAATPVPGPIEELAATPAATPAVATPTPAGIGPLTEYVDPDANLSVGYPTDWRRLTEDEIRAQLGVGDERAVEVALAYTHFVVVSPDGLATFSYTRLPRRPEAESLDDVVQAMREANAASVFGIGEIITEALVLDGVDAVRLSFNAADPATGAVGERLVRQLIATSDDSTVVLTFIIQADSAAMFEETVQQIEESWSWHLQS